MQERIQQIREKTQQIIARAQELYGVDLSRTVIRFDLTGRVAGWAISDGRGNYAIRYNVDMIQREAFNHIINETVPHEIAHLVCFANPRLGSGHNAGWARVCRALGGTGKTRHNERVVSGRGYTYEYTTDIGHKVWITEKYHGYIQRGHSLNFKRGKGTVQAYADYYIVGQSGSTFPTPVFRRGNRPANQLAQEIATVNRVVEQTVKEPTQNTVKQPTAQPVPGESKAATSRRIMLSGYRDGRTYEEIIAAMIAANGYDRSLARATFKANASKVGIPDTFK